jgi:hypothetical protein
MTVGSQGYGGGMSLFGGHLAGKLALLTSTDGEALLKKYDPHRFFELPPLITHTSPKAMSCVSLF